MEHIEFLLGEILTVLRERQRYIMDRDARLDRADEEAEQFNASRRAENDKYLRESLALQNSVVNKIFPEPASHEPPEPKN